MTKSAWQRLFATATWRGWRERFRRWEQAAEYDDVDLLERRIRQLELQVAELQSKVSKSPAAMTDCPPRP